MSLASIEMRLTEHPRARAGIRRSKGAAGLGVLCLVALLSWRAGLPWEETGLRSLAAGIVAYFVAWRVALIVWRQIALAELETARVLRTERLAAQAGEDG